MNLENQVCSLELAKRLKELGVKQESHFVWSNYNFEDEVGAFVGFDKGVDRWVISTSEEDEGVSAFTASELMEMLPDCIKKDGCILFLRCSRDKQDSNHFIEYVPLDHDEDTTSETLKVGKTEAEARGKMLVYLIELGINTKEI